MARAPNFFDRLLGGGDPPPEAPDPEDAPSRRQPGAVPWDQAPGEPEEAYGAFLGLLHAPGTPSIASWARESSGRSTGQVMAWSARYRWSARRRAYLHALSTEAERAGREAVAAMAQAHAETWQATREGLAKELLDRIAEGRLGTLATKDLIAALKTSTEQERVIAGDVATRVGFRADTSKIPQELLDQLDEALGQEGT